NEAPAAKWVVELPLLFEIGAEKDFDYTICVYSSENVQDERLKKIGPSLLQLEGRQSRQLSSQEKMLRADFVLINNTSSECLKKQLDLRFLKSLT
ncbi:MAG: dephospho-CoA kinase, partial [Bdellovibrionota bacterium]